MASAPSRVENTGADLEKDGKLKTGFSFLVCYFYWLMNKAVSPNGLAESS